jgi:EamA domain-containing membrane protein RarD
VADACISSWTAAVAAAGFVSALCFYLFVFGSSHTSLQVNGLQTFIKQFFKISTIKAQITTRI